VPGAGQVHVPDHHDIGTEGDVAVDLEAAAAAQRRDPGREPLLEVGQQLVEVTVQRDHGLGVGAGAQLPVIGQLVGVVIAQMPCHIHQLVAALVPVMRDTRDAPAGGARPRARVVHLADDGVFGAGDPADSGDRGGDGLPAAMRMDRRQVGRRIGHHQLGFRSEKLCDRIELAVIDVCEAAANAQAEYFSQLHDGATTKQYAQKFISDPGKHNGLYWESPEGQPKSPLGPLAAFATSEGYSVNANAHTPFHGYYFHMLQGQTGDTPGGAKEYVINGQMINGFAFIAYPAEYGNSGVMTFMINQDGVLLEKDLGKSTAATAAGMNEFDPDAGWKPVA